jgi:hypothetical protein
VLTKGHVRRDLAYEESWDNRLLRIGFHESRIRKAWQST